MATYRAIVLRTDSYVLQQYFSTHPFPILEITKVSYDILKKKENTIEKLMVQYSYHWKRVFLLLLQFDEKLKRNGAKANVDCSIGIKETRERET